MELVIVVNKTQKYICTSIYFILHRLSLNQLDYSEVHQNIKKTKQKNMSYEIFYLLR